MAFNVSTFRSKMARDGARPNLFKVIISGQTDFFTGDSDLEFFVKTAQIPGTTLGTVTQDYMGRQVKFAGNRTFGDWSMTVINDENFSYRSQFENWMNNINSHITNKRASSAGSSAYTLPVTIQQLSKAGDDDLVLRNYYLMNAFPTDLGSIDLDWGSNDTIEEYTVTFAYDYWMSVGGTITEGFGTPVSPVA